MVRDVVEYNNKVFENGFSNRLASVMFDFSLVVALMKNSHHMHI